MRDINKILEKVEYDKRVNEALTTKIDTEYSLVSNKRRLSKLNNIIRLDSSVKISGLILYLISVLGLLATTSLSVSGGIDRYSGIARTAFIISICFVQLVIFTVSAKESVIKKRFNIHYAKFKVLQSGLLLVSVYYSYEFYIKHIDNPSSVLGVVVTVLLCCLVDFSTIALVSLAFDKRMLNYTEQDSIETRNLLYMIFYNSLFGIRLKALKQYRDNVLTLKQEVSKDNVLTDVVSSKSVENTENANTFKDTVKTSSVKTSKDNVVSLNKRVINVETDVKTNNVKSYLVKTCSDGDKVDVKMLKESFSLTAREWQKIKNEIPELVTKGTNTYYLKNTASKIN